MIAEPQGGAPLQLQAGRHLLARQAAGRVFAAICTGSVLVAVALLAVLLFDVFGDALGWVAGRIDRDPRMFAQMYERDAEFAARAATTAPELEQQRERKVSARQRKAQREGRALSAAEEQALWLDVLHTAYSKDPRYFERFAPQPSAIQRLQVAGWIARDLLLSFPSRHPSKAGLYSAVIGTLWLLACTALMSIPLGVAAAVYLEEYAAKNRLSRMIEVNIANLAGVPSIVYGILGLVVFVRGVGWGNSVLAGAATMSLLVLPVIIIAAREALKAVPDSLRLSAFALGASRWEVTRHHVLPAALPGILTGVILAMSRAIGETAPMIMIGALSYVAFVPKTPLDDFTVLPIQIYNWVAMPQAEFHMLGAVGIVILLLVLLLMNGAAIYIRHRAQKDLRW